MTIHQLELLIELHRRIADLARRSPTFRVLVVGTGVLGLLQRIDATATTKEPGQ
jgi:hypothetical protein